MFLIGISAHLMIYLLFPAFLVVFLYFKGARGAMEINIPSQGVHYECPAKVETVIVISQTTQNKEAEEDSGFEEIERTGICVVPDSETHSPVLSLGFLRAPPSCFA